jgi:hypothetical protein
MSQLELGNSSKHSTRMELPHATQSLKKAAQDAQKRIKERKAIRRKEFGSGSGLFSSSSYSDNV